MPHKPKLKEFSAVKEWFNIQNGDLPWPCNPDCHPRKLTNPLDATTVVTPVPSMADIFDSGDCAALCGSECLPTVDASLVASAIQLIMGKFYSTSQPNNFFLSSIGHLEIGALIFQLATRARSSSSRIRGHAGNRLFSWTLRAASQSPSV
ncbi:hypothetical protein G7Z17_g466 [Cylindrodendrum hubeiense]|uniref:Uncharacterized protein n=1 Tax=Cylindrodendrum hubeiense TaxID=595255 RepID=A0A9P5HKF0_9HYPO|nr:hypothetical protein G7Z17_g466 [Cylindrodendrum hubeiense]